MSEQAIVEQTTRSQPATVANETQAVLSMIERVAANPDADIEKLEKMLDMQERILNRNAKQEFSSALASLQSELPEVERVAQGHNVMYAKFEHILAAIKPHLIDHGFAITHRCNNDNGGVVVTAVLSHKGGHSEETSVTLPADTSGSKNAVQAIGSSMEYGRRYTMNALLGIATKNADDDGSKAIPHDVPEHVQKFIDKFQLAESVKEAGSIWGEAGKTLKKSEMTMLVPAKEEAKRRLANGARS